MCQGKVSKDGGFCILILFKASGYRLENPASKLTGPHIALLVCMRSKKLEVKHRLRTNVPS